MKLNELTVRTRLSLGFGLLSALLLAVAGSSLYALSESNARLEAIVSGINARERAAMEARAAIDQRALAARNLVLASDDAARAAHKAAAEAAHQLATERMTQLMELSRLPDVSERGRELIGEMARVEGLYAPVALDVVSLAAAGRRDEAIARMVADCLPRLQALGQAADRYLEFTQELSRQRIEQASAAYADQRKLLIGLCVIAVAAALYAGWRITRGISQALGAEPLDLGRAAQRVAEGNLGPVPGAQAAPAGSVLASLGHMQAALAGLVGQVRETSESILTGSSQIATGNADLSQRTEEQASSLQQTAASMEQLTGTVKANADTAQHANEVATRASESAAHGGEVMTQVVSTMEDISAASKRITDIISVIDGIAFQTNILALNAAVEAARAGEQGRGFAVVATEVRNLAQRSANAAKEIKTLIGQSEEKVSGGTRLVHDAGRAMEGIVQQVRQVSSLISEISAATREQTSGIGQVGTAVSQLDTVTQQNAALVEQSAAAASSLRGQAEQLWSVVNVFKLADAPGGAAR